MSCSFSFHIPKALPPLCNSWNRTPQLFVASKHEPPHSSSPSQTRLTSKSHKLIDHKCLKSSLAIQIGALLACAEQPALAVTGENNVPDLNWVLVQLGIVLFFYFIVIPPIIMNWLRIRWYKRKLLEMYLQFMFVFIFFPGILVWAPFLNFRKLPRDPSLKYPWSAPEDPSKVKSAYLKYPFAEPEDYL